MFVLDFDGVIFDSVDECALNAFNSAQNETFCLEFNQLPLAYRTLFRNLRYLVQPAGDLILLAKWCLEHSEFQQLELDYAAFTKLSLGNRSSLEERRKHFFAQRQELMRLAATEFYRLNRPYSPLWECLKQGLTQPLLVLTNKNRQAVLDLFSKHGLQVAQNQIYAADSGLTKKDNFIKLAEDFHSSGAYEFIDDSVLNLIELKRELGSQLQVNFYLAKWGYVNPAQDFQLAEQNGISLIGQSELCKRLKT